MELKRTFCVRFNRKSGKIDMSLSALGNAMLRLWAVQNTTAKSKDSIIFDEDGNVLYYFEGTGDFPHITDYTRVADELGYQHIDEFCPGLLEVCKKEEN